VAAKDTKGKGKAIISDAHEESIGTSHLSSPALKADWILYSRQSTLGG
jgi:hypothetical protein